MTRAELVGRVASQSGISLKEADRIIRITLDTIINSMSEGEKITLSGFGTFESRRRKATVACNPKTGKRMPIAEQNIATFRAGTTLRQAVK